VRIALSAGLAALAVIGVSTSGQAQQSPARWSGFYAGFAAGFADVSSDVQLSAASATTTFNTCQIVPNLTPGSIAGACAPDPALFPNGNIGTITGPFNMLSSAVSQLGNAASGEANWHGSVLIGFDQHIAPNLVAGLLADVAWNGAESNFSISGQAASISGRLQFDYLVTAGARLGWVLPDNNSLLYLYGGYTIAEPGDSTATVTSSAGSTTFKMDTFRGFSVGGGGEVQLGTGWFARLDYRYTHLNGRNFDFSHSSSSTVPGSIFATCGGPAGVDCQKLQTTQTTATGSGQIEPDIHSVQIMVGYRF
jgi:opacity protein-like surface antigen